jgi:hypothetical protein
MSVTLLSDLSEQVNKFWAPTWKSELMETNIIGSLIDKSYQGNLSTGGDTVYVTQASRPAGQIKSVTDVDASVFATEKLTTSRIAIVADKVVTAAYEFDSLLQLQTELEKNENVIRENLLQAMSIKMNNHIYSKVNASSPYDAVTDFNASQLAKLKKYAGQKKWMKNKGFYVLCDPSYYSDLIQSQSLISSDFVQDSVVAGGVMGQNRYGFTIFEDNSEGLIDVIATEGGTDSEDVALAFHPDFLHLVTQKQPTFEIASLVSNKQLGYILVASMVMGVKEGHDFANLHQVVFNT